MRWMRNGRRGVAAAASLVLFMGAMLLSARRHADAMEERAQRFETLLMMKLELKGLDGPRTSSQAVAPR